jgi:hypothetical protein
LPPETLSQAASRFLLGCRGTNGKFPYSESLQSLRTKRSISHEHQKTSRQSPPISPPRFPVVWREDKPELIAKTHGGIHEP